LAFAREAPQYLNVQLVERENGDFALTIARQLYYFPFAAPFHDSLAGSGDGAIAGIAANAANEGADHLRHASEWGVRLGERTAESRRGREDGIDELWMYAGELFEVDGVDRAMIEAGIGIDTAALKPRWDATVDAVLAEATLRKPSGVWMATGGR